MPLATLDVVLVLSERELLFGSCEVEYLGGVVFRAADELHATRREAQIVDFSAA